MIDTIGERVRVADGDAAIGEYILFEGVEPGIDDLAERAWRMGGGAELLDEAAVDGLKLMERCLSLGDLDLGGGHAAPLGPFCDPAREERLARTVLTTDRLECGPSGRDAVELFVDGTLEPVQANREQVEASLRYCPPAKRVDNLGAAGRADRYRFRHC